VDRPGGAADSGTEHELQTRNTFGERWITFDTEAHMRSLLYIAILLIIIWAVARLVAGVAGALLNILWIVALVMLVIWLFGLVTGRNRL
jgi:hypothetical protein